MASMVWLQAHSASHMGKNLKQPLLYNDVGVFGPNGCNAFNACLCECVTSFLCEARSGLIAAHANGDTTPRFDMPAGQPHDRHVVVLGLLTRFLPWSCSVSRKKWKKMALNTQLLTVQIFYELCSGAHFVSFFFYYYYKCLPNSRPILFSSNFFE